MVGLLAIQLSLAAIDEVSTNGAPLPSGSRIVASTSITNLDMVLSETPSGNKTMHLLPGSLGEHVVSNVLVRLQGKSPVEAMEMFLSKRTEATNIVRNPGFWLNDLPETTAYSAIRAYGISAGRISYGVNATLLTRRHFFQWKHNQVPIGSLLVYVTKENRRIVRSVIDWYPIGKCDTNHYNGTNDGLIVQQLNEAVPEEITPLKTLPDDANCYYGELPTFVSGHQSKKFGLSEHASAPFVSQGVFEIFRPIGGPRLDWYVPMVGGDSGCTTEYIINGHLVLAMPQSSPILAAVTILNSRHATTELPSVIDLSSFPRVR